MICPRCRKCALVVDPEAANADYCPRCGFILGVDHPLPKIPEWLKVKK